MLLEMRNNLGGNVVDTPSFELHRLIALVGTDRSATEVPTHQLQDLGSVSVLRNREAWPHLPSNPQCRARSNGNREATFSVNGASKGTGQRRFALREGSACDNSMSCFDCYLTLSGSVVTGPSARFAR